MIMKNPNCVQLAMCTDGDMFAPVKLSSVRLMMSAQRIVLAVILLLIPTYSTSQYHYNNYNKSWKEILSTTFDNNQPSSEVSLKIIEAIFDGYLC